MLCVVTEFAQMGLLTSKATGPRGGEMGPRGGEAPAEAEKETMVEGAAKLAGAPICRKKVSRDRRKTPSRPPAFAAGGCRNLLSFFLYRLPLSFSSPSSRRLFYCADPASHPSPFPGTAAEAKRKKRQNATQAKAAGAAPLLQPRAAAAPFFFPDPFFTHFQGRVGL